MRDLAKLIDREDPAWPLVQSWIDKAAVKVEVLPAETAAGDAALCATQVTTRSPMGAITHHAAGILIDHGWLRVLGAGKHPRFQRSLPEWNDGRSNGYYLVADDIVGGFFALNGGAIGEDAGSIYYFAPDALCWQACGLSYSQFIEWALSAKIRAFYKSLRWPGWITEARQVTGDQAISVQPFLFTKGPPLKKRSRCQVPVAELYDLQLSLVRQLDGMPPSKGRRG